MSGLGKGEDARVVLDLLSRVKSIFLGDNPWECPPAPVVSKDIGPMKKYYDELERADPLLIDSRKVVFIGRSGAGKTSLIKSIKAGKGQLTQGEELESVGVSVHGHRFESGDGREADAKLYDLAGQMEYYGLHQLFLSERVLYVLVWNASEFLGHTEELTDHLNDWLATLQMRAPLSRVLLCGTHMDKCVQSNFVTKVLAGLRGSPSVEKVVAGVEQWISERRTGPTLGTSTDKGPNLISGVQLVSSSPTWPFFKSGLPDLHKRLKECGEGTRWLIPPSWRTALVLLDALRDGVNPVEAVRRYTRGEPPLPVVPTKKRSWVSYETLRRDWQDVQNCPELSPELKPDDPHFALEIAMDLRERGGSLLKHPHVVFLDVEELALTLAPILNHKMKQGDASHAYFSVERTPREGWISRARDRLISEGILEARFARLLWKSDDIDMPQQTFDVLVKLGILLPLPRSHESGVDSVLPRAWGNTSLWEHVEEFLVLMRLPLKASCETMNRFNVMEQLREEWGVVAKWEFDHGRAPYGLVERLVASCHAIGNVVTGTCWRGGACFFAHETSRNAAGGYFALALHFTERTNLNRPTARNLVVQAFGHRDGRAVWGALRFIISCVWDLFKEFPGLGWQAWVECPKHNGQVQHYLAGPDDSKGRSPGDPIIPSGERPSCQCQRGVAFHLGTVLRTPQSRDPSPIAEVFNTARDEGRGHRRSDEYEEGRFKMAFDSVLSAMQKAPIADETMESSSLRIPEWVKDAAFAGPAGALALYETWSPLSKVVDYWREGKLEQAIPLTIFAVFLAVVVVGATAVIFRKLRLKYKLWPRTDTKSE